MAAHCRDVEGGESLAHEEGVGPSSVSGSYEMDLD